MDRLRAMELFSSIAKTQNFSVTARRFGLSGTAVSRIITDLEAELNVKLLTRTTRHVVLTESGQEYSRRLEILLPQINELQGSITAIHSAPRGLLRVNSRTMFGLRVLPGLITSFARLWPEIQIELTLSEEPVDLGSTNIDIDFRIHPPVEAGVKRRRLFLSKRYLVASPSYVAGRPTISRPEDIALHNCLAYLEFSGHYAWNFKENKGAQLKVDFVPRHVSNNGFVLLELARNGDGVALLNDYTVSRDMKEGRLVTVLDDWTVSNRGFDGGMSGIYAVILDTPIIPAKIKLFLDFVAENVSGADSRFLQL